MGRYKRIELSPTMIFMLMVVLLFGGVNICSRCFRPKVSTAWASEMTHQRDSIVRELKKEGVFFNIKE